MEAFYQERKIEMSTLLLIFREIAHRKMNFALGVLSVAMTVFVALSSWAMLEGHDKETDEILNDHQTRTEQILNVLDEQTAENMRKLEDAIRKQMKGLGFNIFIYPEGQDMSEVYSQGFASKTMPEEYVTKLANSEIVTVNHLLPRLTRKLKWEEQNRTVVIIGVRGEVPIAFKDPKKPLIDPVAKGELVMGYELHKSLNLEVGDRTTLMGREFKISKLHPERGTVDDITIWLNLEEAQELLDKPGQINAILALECNCESIDRLGEVRAEISRILPGTQVIEKGSRALARAEARVHAKMTAVTQRAETLKSRNAQLENEKNRLANLRKSREKMFSVIVPFLVALCLVIVGVLSFSNVRDRQSEIGIFRAMGVSGNRILGVFLGRAWMLGISGVLIGILVLLVGVVEFPSNAGILTLLGQKNLFCTLVGVPVLACGAAWLPSLAAAQKDPAEVLRHD